MYIYIHICIKDVEVVEILKIYVYEYVYVYVHIYIYIPWRPQLQSERIIAGETLKPLPFFVWDFFQSWSGDHLIIMIVIRYLGKMLYKYDDHLMIVISGRVLHKYDKCLIVLTYLEIDDQSSSQFHEQHVYIHLQAG
jgi:hypothetical protein